MDQEFIDIIKSLSKEQQEELKKSLTELLNAHSTKKVACRLFMVA